MNPELFDTHIHLDRIPPDVLENELAQAQAIGITSFLVPGIEQSSWGRMLEIAEEHSGVYLAPGLHPLAAASWSQTCEKDLALLLSHPAVVAIGEIGLDNTLAVEISHQEEVYRAQLRIAVSAGYPVLLHCRGTLMRSLQIFQEEQGPKVGGILHAFSGSLEIARLALDLNLILSFGGAITWPGARRAPQALCSLPATAFVLESDAPDQSPTPHRHEKNRPLWLELIARQGAVLRKTTKHQLAVQTTANARRLLRLPEHAHTLPKE